MEENYNIKSNIFPGNHVQSHNNMPDKIYIKNHLCILDQRKRRDQKRKNQSYFMWGSHCKLTHPLTRILNTGIFKFRVNLHVSSFFLKNETNRGFINWKELNSDIEWTKRSMKIKEANSFENFLQSKYFKASTKGDNIINLFAFDIDFSIKYRIAQFVIYWIIKDQSSI